MTTEATIDYEWVPNYISYWDSDGIPDHVLSEEILPLIYLHYKNEGDFYKELLNLSLISRFEYVEYANEYNVSIEEGGVYQIQAGEVVMEARPENKTVKIIKSGDDKDWLSSLIRGIKEAGWSVITT